MLLSLPPISGMINLCHRAGEVIQHLRVLVAFTEDLSLDLSANMAVHNLPETPAQNSSALF